MVDKNSKNNKISETKIPAIEDILMQRGFKEIDGFQISTNHWTNPVDYESLKYCLRDLLNETQGGTLTDFVIVPLREATSKDAQRGYYNVYVLPD